MKRLSIPNGWRFYSRGEMGFPIYFFSSRVKVAVKETSSPAYRYILHLVAHFHQDEKSVTDSTRLSLFKTLFFSFSFVGSYLFQYAWPSTTTTSSRVESVVLWQKKGGERKDARNMGKWSRFYSRGLDIATFSCADVPLCTDELSNLGDL